MDVVSSFRDFDRLLKAGSMNLNTIAISLIQLNPENDDELKVFHENLFQYSKRAPDVMEAIMSEACEEAGALLGKSAELRKEGIVKLGKLLEKAMELSEEGLLEEDKEERKEEANQMPLKEGSKMFTLSEEFDADLYAEFVVESTECCNAAEAAILDWEKDPNNQELLNTIFRSFHTIKGTSSFINLNCIKDIAHQAESILVKVRDGQDSFTAAHADIALKSLDIIKIILGRMKSSGPGQQIELPAGYDDLLALLGNFIAEVKKSKTDMRADKPQAEAPEEQKAQKEPEIFANKSASSSLPEWTPESTVRVKIDRLDKLLDTVGELVIAHTMVAQDEFIAGGKNHELNKKISHTGKIVRELQDLSMVLRMVPLKGTFQKMARLARDLSQKHGKMVNFITEGEDTEIDRSMVDMIADPLIHLIRNAVDHGIEDPREREQKGKAKESCIYLTAGRAEGSIVIKIGDDGRGLDRQKIVARAVEKGLIESAERMSDQEVWQFIFQPGFSTAEKVTEVSGRGVGLDVVRQAVEDLRGRIEVQSAKDRGSTFIMRFPLTLAITDGMIIKVGSQQYVLPTLNIHKAIKPKEEDISTVNRRAEMLILRDEVLPIFRLHRLFNISDAQTSIADGLLIVIGEGNQRCALFVDDLLSQTQVVTKSLGKGIEKVPGIAGGAIMSDGMVGLILDVSGIIEMSRQQSNAIP